MTHCVLDCSVAIAWCFEDEANPATDALLDSVARHGAVVPALWPVELANTLRGGLRRQRIDPARLAAVLAQLARLDLRLSSAVPEHPARIAATLAEASARSGLTAYDQSCLDVARATALPLATLDAALRHAAAEAGVAVLPG